MIEGADRSTSRRAPRSSRCSGFDGQTSVTLVRNPSYTRDGFAGSAPEPSDGFGFTIDSSIVDIFDKYRGEQARRRAQRRSLRGPRAIRDDAVPAAQYLHVNPGDRTGYIVMNLTQPPFDDVHVRRAMNWVIDKAALRQIMGGPTDRLVANHIVPDTCSTGSSSEYAPYRTPGDHGSLAKAKAAMKGSPYDTHRDGTCSDPRCKNVPSVDRLGGGVRTHPPDDPGGRREARHHVRRADDQQRVPDRRHATAQHCSHDLRGVGKDYADPLDVPSSRSSTAAPSRRRGTSTRPSSGSRPHRRRLWGSPANMRARTERRRDCSIAVRSSPASLDGRATRNSTGRS